MYCMYINTVYSAIILQVCKTVNVYSVIILQACKNPKTALVEYAYPVTENQDQPQNQVAKSLPFEVGHNIQ